MTTNLTPEEIERDLRPKFEQIYRAEYGDQAADIHLGRFRTTGQYIMHRVECQWFAVLSYANQVAPELKALREVARAAKEAVRAYYDLDGEKAEAKALAVLSLALDALTEYETEVKG